MMLVRIARSFVLIFHYRALHNHSVWCGKFFHFNLVWIACALMYEISTFTLKFLILQKLKKLFPIS
jgi:hypothetical protein